MREQNIIVVNGRKRVNRAATVRKKVLENEKFSRSEKSQGITFSVSEI